MAAQDITRIASNIGALNSLWALQNINKQLGVHQTRLATGKRINSASDDPAGLTIATKLNARSEGLKVALNNIGDAKNLLAVAESGVSKISDILIQMKNKAAQGASDTLGTNERDAIKSQLNAYAQQIDDLVSQTEWNGNKLIDGRYNAGTLSFQTGTSATDVTDVSGLTNLSASDVNGAGHLGLATRTSSATATEKTDGDGILNDGQTTAVAKANINLSSLASGTYTVRLTMDAATGTDDKIELLDSNGIAQLISQSPADGLGSVANSVLIDADTDQTLNFGNGLSVQIKGGKGAGVYSATVQVAQSGEYEVKASGDTGNSLTTADDFRSLLTALDTKMSTVSTMMSKIGSFTGRLEFKEDQVMSSQINVEASYSRIMNANMAEEQVQSSKYQILQQTSIAMLAQANSAPQSLLSLFR